MLTYVKSHWKEFVLFVVAGVVVAVIVSKLTTKTLEKADDGSSVINTKWKGLDK